ncbi:lipoprotein [gut metagenome]|uniref:Lipoprotein n=1 Tax=gut metagenome TaxID=749906 RepID=J9FK94_9ZZZZ
MTLRKGRLFMKRILCSGGLLILLAACTPNKMKINPLDGQTDSEDSAAYVQAAESMDSMWEENTFSVPTGVEQFDDFIFNFASDPVLQRQRTEFPLPYYTMDNEVQKISEKEWKHDNLFTKQNFYTLLFDREKEMDVVGDTSQVSVQVEWIFLKTHQLKSYCFERKQGVWMLVAVHTRPIAKGINDNFVEFYTRFANDSVYQLKHVRNPLQFVTIDPDDEFSILETTLDANQWMAFRPVLPTDKLSNINYGQKNEDLSHSKILKVNGIGNGYSNIFYFRKRKGSGNYISMKIQVFRYGCSR